MRLSGTKYETGVLLFVVFALSSGIIWVRTATVKDTYRFVQSEKELRKLQQDIQAVRVRWLKMTSPGKLESLAQTLELTPPRIDQVLRYRIRGNAELEMPATGALPSRKTSIASQ